MTIQDMAGRVAGKTSVKDLDTFDITVISVIIGIIVSIVELWKNCKKTPATAVDDIKDMPLIARWNLRRLIHKHVNDEEMHGVLAKPLYNGFVAAAKDLSLDNMTDLFNES